jgi:hypothetical protein
MAGGSLSTRESAQPGCHVLFNTTPYTAADRRSRHDRRVARLGIADIDRVIDASVVQEPSSTQA